MPARTPRGVRFGFPDIDSITRLALRYRMLVLACWLATALVSAVAAMQLPALLVTSLTVPNTDSQRAGALLARHFGENPDGTFAVVSAGAGRTSRGKRAFSGAVKKAALRVPHARVMPVQVEAGLAYTDVVTSLDLQHAQPYTGVLRNGLRGEGRASGLVTGIPAIQHDLNPLLQSDLRRGEAIALPLAVLVLALLLGVRLLAAVPLVFAAFTITVSLGAVYILARMFPMVSYVPNLTELMGLGLAIDYSLLFAYRYREELETDARVEEAIVRTSSTAGKAVFISGLVVAVGLSAVLLVPVPFIRSVGVAGIVVPLISVLGALTLQPALLSFVGAPHVAQSGGLTSLCARSTDRFWNSVAATVLHHSRLTAGASLLVLLLCAAQLWRLSLSPGSFSSVPATTEAARGLSLLRTHVGPGALTPIHVVVDAKAPGAARSAALSSAVLRLGEHLLQDPQVFVVRIGSRPPYTDASARYRRLIVIPRRGFGDPGTQHLVSRLRRVQIGAARFPQRASIFVGGAPAEGVDFLDHVYGAFPWVVAVTLCLAYLVLLRAFRSVVLPLIALMLDVLSVAAACGLCVVVFEPGKGSIFSGAPGAGQIEGWIPIFLFGALFGLSTDYQVFIVSRMREARDNGASQEVAVAEGVVRTGQIVTAAAVIMVVSFSGFIAGHVSGLQQFGTGLSVGILLDATLVRVLLVPSLMIALGPWTWWLPPGLARLMRVAAPPLSRGERRGPTCSE